MTTQVTLIPLIAAAAAPAKKEQYQLSHPKSGDKNILRFERKGTEKQPLQNRFVGTTGINIHDFIDFVKGWTPEDSLRHCEMDFAIPQDTHQKKNFITKDENPDHFEIILISKEIGKPWLKGVLRKGDTIILRSSTFDTNYKKEKFISHNHGNFVVKTLFLVDVSFWVKLKQSY